MKKLILAAVVVALSGGAAMADRHHGGGGGGWGRGGQAQGGVVVRGNGGFHGSYNAGYNRGYGQGRATVVVNNGYRGGYSGGYVEPRYYHTRGVARSTIWLERPVISNHYYRYDYRPNYVVEDYGPRDGYIFMRGEWQWSGYEWVWQPGHYEPDTAYVEVY